VENSECYGQPQVEIDWVKSPTSEKWKWELTKEICLIAHGLTHEGYSCPLELRNRLQEVIEKIDAEHGQTTAREMLDVLGMHVSALMIAAGDLASMTGIDVKTVERNLLVRGAQHYQSCPENEFRVPEIPTPCGWIDGEPFWAQESDLRPLDLKYTGEKDEQE
jgi:hypothetical protein